MQGLVMKYFVLKPGGTDVYAEASRDAMLAYASAVQYDNPALARELTQWVASCVADIKTNPSLID